jgi:hypothetical protein
VSPRMRNLPRILSDAGRSFGPVEIYSTQADSLTTAKPRPVAPRPWPWFVWLAVGAAIGAVIFYLATFAVDAVQTAAADAVAAQHFNPEDIE